jgi:hypothetical protein
MNTSQTHGSEKSGSSVCETPGARAEPGTPGPAPPPPTPRLRPAPEGDSRPVWRVQTGHGAPGRLAPPQPGGRGTAPVVRRSQHRFMGRPSHELTTPSMGLARRALVRSQAAPKQRRPAVRQTVSAWARSLGASAGAGRWGQHHRRHRGAQAPALVVQRREHLSRAQRRVVEVEGHALAEDRLEAPRRAHRGGKLPLLDGAIEGQALGHAGWHREPRAALHVMAPDLADVRGGPARADAGDDAPCAREPDAPSSRRPSHRPRGTAATIAGGGRARWRARRVLRWPAARRGSSAPV